MAQKTTLKVLVVISVLLTVFIAGTASAELRALYEFEGNYNNSVNGLVATPVGDVTIVYDSDRDSNVASFYWNGYVDCGWEAFENIEEAITVSLWMKTWWLGYNSMPVSKGYAWSIRGDDTNSLPCFYTNNTNLIPNEQKLFGTTDIADWWTWHHVAGVYDGQKKYLYVDGNLEATAYCNGTLNTWYRYPFAIGAQMREEADGSPSSGFPKCHYGGYVDDVRVYDEALTGNEIWLLKNTSTESLEAENATLNGVSSVADPCASGGYRVGSFDQQGNYILFDTIPDGNYLEITYSLDVNAVRQCSIYVNGSDAAKAMFAYTGSLNTYDTLVIKTDITNNIKLQIDSDDQSSNGGQSCASIDKIEIFDEAPPSAIVEPNHPFLIVDEANYPALRARASQWPWSNMKTDAISDATNLVYDPCLGPDYTARCMRLRDIVSSNALAYILDPCNSDTYKNKIRDELNTGLDDLAATRAGVDGWMANTALGSALFNAILAMDIVHSDLTSAESDAIEAKIDSLVWLISGWDPSPQGVKGLWTLYKGDTVKFNNYRIHYKNALFGLLTADGVFKEGCGYAAARFGNPDREQKSVFLDILEYQGYHDFYSNDRLRNFYEWLYGHAETPFGRIVTFGDSSPTSSIITSSSTQIWRAYRFSDKAARYAAWHTSGITPEGRLLTYALMEQAPSSSPQLAPSRIFTDGGVWFGESTQSPNVLKGGLWNPKSSGSHSHKEINALALSGYGEHLLLNAGYAGYEEPNATIWNYINNSAFSGNTALIAKTDHSSEQGAGITEGFTGLKLDYASGASGDALPNGDHQRNFVFVHPADGANGYWVLFDEVNADNPTNKANLLWHPDSNNITVVSNEQEYRSEIDMLKYSGGTVYLTIFLGTPPVSNGVEMNEGWLANWNWIRLGDYLLSKYATVNGLVNVVTVLFPHDSSHAKATMARVTGTGYTGASIVQGSIEDIALESASTSTVTYDGVSFQGLATWYRLNGSNIDSYFVRKGRSFNDGSTPRVGFASASDVSIYLDNAAGRIVSPGTNVTFYYPDIGGVHLNGLPLPMISSGADFVEVNIHQGTHEIELYSWNVADFDNTGIVDFKDFAILASQWQQAPGTPSADIAPIGGDGIVDIQDLVVFVSVWLESRYAADFEPDGDVDFADFAVLANEWGQTSGVLIADISPSGGDGRVDFEDLATFVSYWLAGN